jgi:hypothetical protein
MDFAIRHSFSESLHQGRTTLVGRASRMHCGGAGKAEFLCWKLHTQSEISPSAIPDP